jgi:hypothetical protein
MQNDDTVEKWRLADNLTVGYCGVCCSHCGVKSRVPEMAQELKRFVQAYKYGDWIPHITHDFEFENFMKGLSWFVNSSCKGCLKGGGMPSCEVRICCKEKSLKNCYSCGDFLKCDKLKYQKATYKIDENYKTIREIGYENWLKSQEEKARKDFDNIHFLDRRT